MAELPGYYNFNSQIEGQQQLDNSSQYATQSLVNLGKQISGAIENKAALDSASAMLPMVQQSYQQGINKIAQGDVSGLGDVMGAATIAGRNPVLAPIAGQYVSTANNALQQQFHTMRTLASIGAQNLRTGIRYPGSYDPTTGGLNPNYTPPQKPLNIIQQMNGLQKWHALDTGYQNQMQTALKQGDQQGYNQALQARLDLTDKITQGGVDVSASKGISLFPYQQAQEIQALHKQISAEMAKGSGGMFGGGKNQDLINQWQSKIQALQQNAHTNLNQAAQSDPSVSLIQRAQQAIQNGKDPSAVRQVLRNHGVDPSALDEVQQPQGASSQQSQPQQATPPQASTEQDQDDGETAANQQADGAEADQS